MKNYFKELYGYNPFAGKVVENFKIKLGSKESIYPKSGAIRFSIQLDKNGQICEIRESVKVKKEGSKPYFYIGERPRELFEKVKGRPFGSVVTLINEYIIQEGSKYVQ